MAKMHDDWDADEVPALVNEPEQVISALARALTERHTPTAQTTYGGIFSLEATTDSPYKSQREEGLDPVQVVKFLTAESVPWSVDWVDMSFPVHAVNEDPPTPWTFQQGNRRDWTHMWSVSIPIREGWASVSVKQRFNGLTAFVSFNPTSCLNGPKTLLITPLNQALVVTQDVLDAVEHWVTPACPRELFSLSRLDLNKTPEPVADVQRLLNLVKDAPLRGRPLEVFYGTGGRIQTVWKKPTSTGGFVVYDKGLQAGLVRQAVRFEVQVHRRRLRNLCPVLKDLDEEILTPIALSLLDPVVKHLLKTPQTALDDILSNPDDVKILTQMLGISLLHTIGHFPTVTRHMMSKRYKPLLQKYDARTVGDLLRVN